VWLTIALIGIAALNNPAASAESGELPVLVVASPNSVDHPLPETTPGGTVVLRGSRPVSPATNQNSAANQSSAGSSTSGAIPRPIPATGLDRNYDTNVDRGAGHDFDTTGINLNFDRTGLHP
jgi:hypothetical protein